MKIFCSLLDHGWIHLAFSKKRKEWAVNGLERKLHILKYDTRYKRYITSIYEFERLYDFCEDRGIKLSVTERLLRYYRRLKYKAKRLKQASKNGELHLDLWTKDKKRQLYTYQKKCVNACVEAKRYLVGDGLGVGKTPQAIATILKAFQDYDYESALVVCPNGIKDQWQGEFAAFTQLPVDDVNVIGKAVCYTKQAEKYTARGCKECKFFQRCKEEKATPKILCKRQIADAKILIMNYAKLRIYWEEIAKKQFDVLIFDEATKIKNHNADVTRAAKKIVRRLDPGAFIIPMSGTFIENRLEELYTILDIIDDKIVGPYALFKERYLVVDFWGKVMGYRNKKQLKKKLDKVLIRRTIDDVWAERPPIVEITRECQMSTYQSGIYATAREGVLKDIADAEKAKKINQAMLATLIGYLLQVCDTVKSIDPECTHKEHSCKMEALKEIITGEVSGKEKMVIFSKFANKAIPYIMEELRALGLGRVRKIVGGCKNRQQIVDDFHKQKEFRFLVCSDSMAYGVNLQCANHIVNFDLPWNPAIIQQIIGRVYRLGQKRSVNVINFIIPGTIEEHLYAILAAKRDLAAQFLKPGPLEKPKKMDLFALAKKI